MSYSFQPLTLMNFQRIDKQMRQLIPIKQKTVTTPFANTKKLYFLNLLPASCPIKVK